jgi:MoxR-like ATPase
MTNESEDIQTVQRLGEARDKIVTELRKTIVGMDEVIDEMMIAIFARGHCLQMAMPVSTASLSSKFVTTHSAFNFQLFFRHPCPVISHPCPDTGHRIRGLTSKAIF